MGLILSKFLPDAEERLPAGCLTDHDIWMDQGEPVSVVYN